jgi:hypothetical protein
MKVWIVVQHARYAEDGSWIHSVWFVKELAEKAAKEMDEIAEQEGDESFCMVSGHEVEG